MWSMTNLRGVEKIFLMSDSPISYFIFPFEEVGCIHSRSGTW
jgi:hypothetical protein